MALMRAAAIMLRAVVPTSVVYAGCTVCGQRVSGKVAVASEGAERVLTPQLAASIVHRTLVYIYALCPVDTIATFAAAVRPFPVKVTVLVAPSVVIFAVIFCLWLADIVDS